MEIWYRADTGLEYLYSRMQSLETNYDGLDVGDVSGEDYTMPSKPLAGGVWGSITGTIEDQKDLIAKLETLKEEIVSGEIDLSQYVKHTDLDTFKKELDELINQLSINLQIQIQEEQQAREQAITELSNSKLDVSTYTEDKQETAGNFSTLELKIKELESKITDIKSLDPEVVVLYEGGDTDYTNKQKDFILSGVVNTGTSIKGNNITLHDTTIKATFMNLTAAQDITVNDTTLTGLVPFKITDALFAVHADGYVAFRDCTFTPEACYNGIDIGNNMGLAKSITIENVDFDGLYNNNAITLYGIAENGVITISNCKFKDVKNVIKLCNRTNVPFTLNMINCTIEKMETGEFGGIIALEDMTSETAEEANTNDLFSKVTINLQNVTIPTGKIPTDPATICGTQDDKQLIYVYDELRGHVAYGDKYPTIHIM